jgi:acylphosphatase
MIKRLVISIEGKVQGIYFRASAMDRAEKLGLAGVARNEADGSVYIEVEGEQEKLDEFLNWCRIGPPAAELKEVNSYEEPPRNFKKFTVE